MNSATYEKAAELFAQACQQSKNDRASWIEGRCPDPAVRELVHAMLLQDDAIASEDDVRVDSSSAASRTNKATTKSLVGTSQDTDIHTDNTQEPEGGSAPFALGDYRDLVQIADGGMGVVYKATQRSLNRVVAIKMVRNAYGASQDSIDRFRREAEAIARLDHPQIIPVYEIGEHDSQQFFSMKFIEGGNLAQHIANGLQLDTGIQLMSSVARALHYAH
ncbi:MAG: protein kinase, partial [Pseudomonadota bacterium]